MVLPDAMSFGQYPRVVAFAATERLPNLFPEKQVVEAGGLMAYGPSIPAAYRRLAVYVDKIFHGADPAELPVEQPTTFEFASTSRPPRRSASASRTNSCKPSMR
jgi:putative tryptophan/tyrosine transport system substrate-binding protein